MLGAAQAPESDRGIAFALYDARTAALDGRGGRETRGRGRLYECGTVEFWWTRLPISIFWKSIRVCRWNILSPKWLRARICEAQIRIAAGEPSLSRKRKFRFPDTPSNAALRRRSGQQFLPLTREDPFAPRAFRARNRLDDGVYEGFTVSTEYDPMLGKLISWDAIAMRPLRASRAPLRSTRHRDQDQCVAFSQDSERPAIPPR